VYFLPIYYPEDIVAQGYTVGTVEKVKIPWAEITTEEDPLAEEEVVDPTIPPEVTIEVNPLRPKVL
jgi:hypothetical protein